MERTSLGEALDKLNSDVASQSVAGLDALKTWLQAPWGSPLGCIPPGTFNHWLGMASDIRPQDPANLEKADDDPQAWPAVLRVLGGYGKRQLDALARGGSDCCQ